MSERRARRTGAQMWRRHAVPEDSAPPPAPRSEDPDAWDFPPPSAASVIRESRCPVCSEGPWKSVLNHVSRAHGIKGRDMREIAGLTTVEKVAEPGLFKGAAGERLALLQQASREGRRSQEWTTAGRAKVQGNLDAVNATPMTDAHRALLAQASKTPEARQRQAQSLRENWARRSDVDREAVAKRLARSKGELSQQATEYWDSVGRKPCGTRASYRRGCRCGQCREAYLAYRREHG